jgi:hypothetical protein
LRAEDISRVLAAADANIFHKSYGDQTGALWSPNGRPARNHHPDCVFQGLKKSGLAAALFSVIPDAPSSERSGIQKLLAARFRVRASRAPE